MKEISQQIANKINSRLKSLRISKTEFAAMVKVPPSAVSKWLSGSHNFTIATLVEIQSALMINFFDLGDSKSDKACFPCNYEFCIYDSKTQVPYYI